MPDKSVTVDAVVVGAGPAGSAAALELAKAGRDVVIVERGAFPGAKNVYGGVVYGRILDEIVPQWWTEVPVQRWVTRRSTMLMTPTQALTVDYRTSAWDSPPYNGMTTYRADFDSWLAAKAVAAGARLVTSTVATGLLREADGRISGVRTDRSDGDIRARIVIACDGVNSFLAKEAGLLPRTSPAHTTLGVKETLALPRDVINERFGLVGDQGLDIEMVGCTSGIPGGGFLYTNLDTVSVGVVVGLVGLAEAKIRPEELVAGVKAHPAIAPYLRGAELKEYSAHLVPEGGYRAMPRLATDGMLVAGDAASMCLAAGLWLEGVNFAIGAGLAAGRTAAEAIAAGDTSARGLAGYRRQLESCFVLADHKRLRNAADIVLADRMQRDYPRLACDFVEQVFTVTNPRPKLGMAREFFRAVRRNDVRAAASGPGWLAGPPGIPVRSEVDELLRRILRRADGDGRVPRRRTGPHHRRLRSVPLLHDQGLRARLPGRPVRAHHRRRHPVQLRAVLRMRNLLSGVQRRGRHHLDVPGRRRRRRVSEGLRSMRVIVAALSWSWRETEVDPLTGAVRANRRDRGPNSSELAALEHALRLGEKWDARVVAASVAPAEADEMLREALAVGAAQALRVEPAVDGGPAPGRPGRRRAGIGRRVRCGPPPACRGAGPGAVRRSGR